MCHTRGDSFVVQGRVSQDGIPVDITDWVIRSQVRNGSEVVAELVISMTDATKGLYRAEALDTTNWPLVTLDIDIHYAMPGGYKYTTPTGKVAVKPGGYYAP
ncbi:head morphogenesis protein [Pseudomonas phage Pa BHU-15]|nr:head morphogenesis protein [Pseudomonas phage Pa BHU-15]